MSATRTRGVIAAIITLLVVLAVWKFIDWRMEPPQPPPALATPAPDDLHPRR